jgi:hypothetical protein
MPDAIVSGLPSASIDAATPLLLLPMRIETRFVDASDGSSLLVRIYPDTMSVDAHDPQLGPGEFAAGCAFWDVAWRAGSSQSDAPLRAAWTGLVRTYRSPRAAWIVRQTTPSNLSARPAALVANGAAPVPAPVFPSPATRASGWNRAATAALLPDAWTVVVQAGSATSTYRGTKITPGLAVSLDPGAAGAFPAGSTVDAGMQWMTDFNAAVTAGMALRIPLDAPMRKSGYDALYVYGLRSEPDSSPGLASLFDAHHYTDGFAFVPQGTPTNNTADAPSGWSIDDADAAYAPEIGTIPAQDPQSDAVRLSSALGFAAPANTFDRVANGANEGVRNGADMLTALWPATLGYFLQQMMSPVFSSAQIAAARLWTIENVVPRGPLPALRTGKTPYGVLLATAVRFYAAPAVLGASSPEPEFVAFLQKLIPAWTSSVAAAPRIGSGDPDRDLMNVLGMDASSITFDGRDLLGQNFLLNWQVFTGIEASARDTWFQTLTTLARQAVTTYGSASWNPFLLSCAFNATQYEIRYPTVTTDPLSETATLAADASAGTTTIKYIAWLQSASYSDVLAENYPSASKTAPTALLYKLLRQSILREYADIASQREIADGRLTAAVALEPELVGVSQAHPAITATDILARPMPDSPALTWGAFLSQVAATPESPYARLGEMRASFARLASLPTAELDRLLSETLDACSHRLDVWLTGVANAILQRTRVAKPAALHAGGYGFVENVRPAVPPAAVAGTELAQISQLDALRAPRLPAGAVLAPPQQPAPDNGGFIYASSYAQASAAAVLRAGYMSHLGTSSEPILSIDLSSHRVKRALWVLDGVRSGQSLSALLGYRFEELLDEANVQAYVQPFRDLFPTTGAELTPVDPAAESVSASDVVDGLALRTAFDAKQFTVGGNWGAGFPPAVAADQTKVVAAIAELDDIMDALSDLSLSESIFQVVRGNFPRAGGLLDAVSRGAYAAQPQVVETARAGIDFTHRVMALFGDAIATAPPWTSVGKHPRAIVEPALDAWVSTLLPDPATVRCVASYTATSGTTSKVVSLLDLDLGPLDVLALADAAGALGGSELEARIRYHAALEPAVDSIAISFDVSGQPAGSIGFPDVLSAARSIRRLIGSARPLAPADLCETQVDPAAAGGAYVSSDIASRVAAVLTSFDAAVTALRSALDGLPNAPDPVRAALVACATFGVADAIPATSSGADPSLPGTGAAVLAEMQKRRAQVATAPTGVDDCTAAVNALFGDSVIVLARTTPPNAAILTGAFGAGLVPATFADAPSAWIQQLTHVRDGISRLDEALTMAELLTGNRPSLQLAQLPPVANDRWLGLPLDPAAPAPTSGRMAIAALTTADLATSKDFAGLVFDEWPERIPSSTQPAGLAFHFDEPKSRAPQALLLAVCPDMRATWDDELLLATLQDALQLAKIRTVDLDSLVEVGQILPAAYVPMNLQQDTIATRFRMTAAEVAEYHATDD